MFTGKIPYSKIFLLLVLMMILSIPSFGYWRMQTLGLSQYFTNVKYFDHSNAFLVGSAGEVYKSVDGGNNWAALVSPPESFYGLTAVASDTAYVGSVSSGKLYKIDAGSVSVEKDFSADIKAIWGVQSRGINKLYLVGTPELSSLTPMNFAKSTNGGSSWTTTLIGSSFEVYLRSVYFVSDDIGWAVGFNKNKFVIYKTINGGSAWTNVYEETNAPYFADIYATDENHVWAVGGYGLFVMSKNGGASQSNWTKKHVSDGGFPSGVKFLNNDIGWVSCISGIHQLFTGIFRTIDGGETWVGQFPDPLVHIDVLQNPTRLITSGLLGLVGTLEAPQITSFSTSELMRGTVTTVSITGIDFQKGPFNEYPTMQFSNTGVSLESISSLSSNEIVCNIMVFSTAELGPVDVVYTNIDTMTSSKTSAFSIIASTLESWAINSIVPNTAYQSEEVNAVINISTSGTDESIFSGTTLEVDLGAGITVSNISLISNNQIAAHLSIAPSAAAGPRNLTVNFKNILGEIVTSETKTAAFTVNASATPGTLPDAQSILPRIGRSGVWDPQKDGDLPVQVKVPVAGSYNVLVATTSGIKYKTVKDLNLGYNKIVIPSNLEFTNGAHVLILQDPRTGKTVKAKFAVNQ